MLSFIVRMTFDQADRDDVGEILCHLTAASRQEPGCVSYIPHFVEGGAARFSFTSSMSTRRLWTITADRRIFINMQSAGCIRR